MPALAQSLGGPGLLRRRWHGGEGGPGILDYPEGRTRLAYLKAFLQEFGLAPGESKAVAIPGGLPMVVGEGLFRDEATGRWNEAPWQDRGPYARLLARTILDPFEVWPVPVELSSGPTESLRLLRPYSLDNGKTIGVYCAFHLIGRRWAAAATFVPKSGRGRKAILEYLEALREGVLVYRETLK